jgi:YD repeat-containing protein
VTHTPCTHAADPRAAARLVGDPVDVVTGAVVERSLEFQLPGPVSIRWFRLYDSAETRRRFALGWGQTHSFDHRLVLDLDGVRHLGPFGRGQGFPLPERDGLTVSSGGVLLQRVSERLFRVAEPDQPIMEFDVVDPTRPTPLSRLLAGDAVVSLRHDDAQRLELIVDALGRHLRVDHDASGLVAVTLHADRMPPRSLLRYEYDERGDAVRGWDAYGNGFSLRYDHAHRIVERTDRRGYTFRFAFDADGRCIYSGGEDGMHAVELRHEPARRATSVRQADGGTWVYEYDEAGAITRVIDPYGATTVYQDDPEGRGAIRIAPTGAIGRVVYAEDGRLLGEQDSLGRFCRKDRRRSIREAEEFFRPQLRPPLAELASPFLLHPPASWGSTSVRNTPVSWEYGNLVAPMYVEPLTAGTALPAALPSWAAALLARESELALPHSRGEDSLLGPHPFPPGAYTYDVNGTLVQHTDPHGATQGWRYDAGGNVVRYRDRNGQVWQYEYRSWDLLSREITPSGRSCQYAFTPRELLASTTDGGGSLSEFRYDLTGRLAAITRDQVEHERYEYDRTGHTMQKLDGQGRLLATVEADEHGLPRVVQYADGMRCAFTYDALGRCVAAKQGECAIELAYDDLGNRVLDARDGKGIAHEFDCYDVTKTTVLDRFVTQYRRSPGCTTIIDPTGAAHHIRTLPGGLLVKELSNRTSEIAQYQFEGRWLLKTTFVRSQSRPGRVQRFRYSAEGDLLHAGSSDGALEYAYDADRRLLAVRAGTRIVESYRFDAADNLVDTPSSGQVTVARGNRIASYESRVVRVRCARTRDPPRLAGWRSDVLPIRRSRSPGRLRVTGWCVARSLRRARPARTHGVGSRYDGVRLGSRANRRRGFRRVRRACLRVRERARARPHALRGLRQSGRGSRNRTISFRICRSSRRAGAARGRRGTHGLGGAPVAVRAARGASGGGSALSTRPSRPIRR